MPEVDSKLAASLKQAKINPMSFVFVAKGNEGKLLVDKKKISSKDADEAKKKCGGGTIYKGRCTGEEGKMVFEVGKEVAPTLAALTKKIIKQDAGLVFEVEYRFAADLAVEEGQAEAAGARATPAAAVAPPPSAPPPPRPQPAQGGAEVAKRLSGMAANIKAALAGPNKARVQTLFISVNSLIKNSDFVQAGKVLDELEPLVAPSSVPHPPSHPVPTQDGTEVMKRLNSMAADIKAAMVGPNKARIQTLFLSVNGLIKKKDFVQAGTVLDELGPLIAKSTGAPANESPREASKTPEIPKGIVAKRQFLLTRWKQIPKDIAPVLEGLLKGIAVKHPDLSNLPELRVFIDKKLQSLYVELQDEIDRAINNGDMTVLKGLRERVLKHEFVNHLMSNPFVSGSRFQSAILDAIQEIQERLAS